MKRSGNFITNFYKTILENKQQAIMFAVIFSLLPFASWLAISLVCLITLRKGGKFGFEVMLPALVMHTVPLMMLLPLDSAVINTLLAFVPCYLAALTLRKTTSWQAVFGVILLQACIGFSLVQWVAPEFAVEQFKQFKILLNQFQEFEALGFKGTDELSSFLLAQLLFGLQILSVIVSSLISLMLARAIQANLFLPGGFAKELLEFRSGRLSFLALMGISIASYYGVSIAINVLPLILSYFFLSGFLVAYYTLAKKLQKKGLVLLLLLIALKPFFVFFAYIVFGALDSLFNFRLYLPVRAKESI